MTFLDNVPANGPNHNSVRSVYLVAQWPFADRPQDIKPRTYLRRREGPKHHRTTRKHPVARQRPRWIIMDEPLHRAKSQQAIPCCNPQLSFIAEIDVS